MIHAPDLECLCGSCTAHRTMERKAFAQQPGDSMMRNREAAGLDRAIEQLTKERDELRARFDAEHALLLEEQTLRHDYGTRLAKAEAELEIARSSDPNISAAIRHSIKTRDDAIARAEAAEKEADLRVDIVAKQLNAAIARAEKAEAGLAQKCVELDAHVNPWRDP